MFPYKKSVDAQQGLHTLVTFSVQSTSLTTDPHGHTLARQVSGVARHHASKSIGTARHRVQAGYIEVRRPLDYETRLMGIRGHSRRPFFDFGDCLPVHAQPARSRGTLVWFCRSHTLRTLTERLVTLTKPMPHFIKHNRPQIQLVRFLEQFFHTLNIAICNKDLGFCLWVSGPV